MLRCAECGHSISISEKVLKKSNSHYTQCNFYRKKGKYGLCIQHRLNYNLLENDLDYVIKEVCNEFLINYNSDSIMKKAENIKGDCSIELENELKKIDKEILKTESIIDSLYMDKFDNIIDENTFQKLFSKQKDILTNLNNRKKNFNDKLESISKNLEIKNYDLCKSEVEKFMSIKKPTRNEISRLVKEVRITETKDITLFFKFKELSLIAK